MLAKLSAAFKLAPGLSFDDIVKLCAFVLMNLYQRLYNVFLVLWKKESSGSTRIELKFSNFINFKPAPL